MRQTLQLEMRAPRAAPTFTGKTLGLKVFGIVALLLSGFYCTRPAQSAESANRKTLSLGIRSEINRSLIAENFREFVRYIAANLAPAADLESKVVVAPTTFQLARLIDEKKVDFYIDSPYPTYLLNEVYGAGKLLLRRWKGGIGEYRSLIFTKKTGGIISLQELKGKIIIFEDPESTSGYFLPRAFLTRKGFFLTDKTRYDPYAAATDVGYLFAYSQQKLVDSVLTNKAAAGAFSDSDYSTLEQKKRAEVAIVAETESLPRHFVSVRTDFPPDLTDRLKKVLLSMDQSEQGRTILKNSDDTTKFDPLPGGDAALRRKMSEIFKSGAKK